MPRTYLSRAGSFVASLVSSRPTWTGTRPRPSLGKAWWLPVARWASWSAGQLVDGLAGAAGGVIPASLHCCRVSRTATPWLAYALWHIVRAVDPHPCSSAPPVVLGTLTVTQPLREAQIG